MARLRSSDSRRRSAELWNALNRVLFVLIVLAGVAGVALWFYPEIQKRDEMLKNLDKEKKELAAEELKRKQREREVHLLETDPQYLEIIARDKLDLMKDGETIFRLDSSGKAEIQPAPALTPSTKKE